MNIEFVTGAVNLKGLPAATLPEVCFVGRSNVGKSSLINALAQRKKLAFVSKTPGRTQEINFFRVDGKMLWADLPGYGYAKTPGKMQRLWQTFMVDYFRTRTNLRRVYLLVDSVVGLKASDMDAMMMFQELKINYALVLTKTDKLRNVEDSVADIDAQTAHLSLRYPKLFPVSSAKKTGIDALRKNIFELTKR